MKCWRIGCLLLLFHFLTSLVSAGATGQNPLEQVIQLLTKMQAQVVKDGDSEEAAYSEYELYCQDKASTTTNEIKNFGQQKAKLEAVISKSESDIGSSQTTIEELVKSISELQAKIKEQTSIREKGKADFQAADTELVKSIDMIGRATEILQKATEKMSLLQTDTKAATSASLVQTAFASKDFESIVEGLTTIMDSAGIVAEDAGKLAALLQQQQDAQYGQPEGGAVTGKASSAIIEVLQDLKDKGEDQLRALRNSEAEASHDFEKVKQALEFEEAQAQKDLEAERKSKSASEEAKAAAEGDLEICVKALAGAKKVLALTQQDCQQKAADHEVSLSGRKKELEALTSAKKQIQSSMFIQIPSAEEDDLSLSFLQLHRRGRSAASARAKMISKEVVTVVKRLAEQQKSADLAQLASRITAVVRYGAKSGRDPLAKVKKLISDMVVRLEREKQAEQTEKEYCDKELGESTSKKEALDDKIEGLKAKIDQAEAASTELKTQVKEIQMELATMAKQSGEAAKARADGHEAYVKTAAKLKQSLESLRSAIKVLRDYYAADEGGESLLQTDDSLTDEMQQPEAPKKYQKSTGGANSIISLLEVCESDVAQELSEEETEEAAAQSAFEKEVEQDQATKLSKDKDIEFKTREFKALDKALTELSEDRDTTEEEMAAVTKYLEQVKERCLKEESFEEIKARRDAEIKGLEQALQILTSQIGFLQRH